METGEAGSADDIPPFAVPPYYYIQQAHEVNPGSTFDFDWTICPDDWPREQALREVQNKWLELQLQKGLTVAYRQSGWSCYPRIHRNDLCYFKPTCGHWDNLKVGDIVFCAVEPGWRYFAHPVKKKHWAWYEPNKRREPCFTIANLQGRENGYCYIDRIWGKLFRAMH